MELPRELSPWAPQLSELSSFVTDVVGPWLPRLQAAVGPLGSRSKLVGGEPDGFDGLDRRGSYERLLLSEWLLAEALPDEFLRRAAQGEQGFFRLARAEPTGSRRTCVLFDAGPTQLGPPRIVHLALLLVFQRRALQRQAELRWGVLQRSGHLESQVGVAELERLVRARSPFEATAEMVQQWAEALAPADADDETWVVGSSRQQLEEHAEMGALGRCRYVEVRDPLEVGVRELEVSLNQAGHGSRRLRLALPPPVSCVRLLRDPLSASASLQAPIADAGPARFARVGPLIFSRNGQRVLAPAEPRGLLGYPIPNSTRAPRGKPRFLPIAAGEKLVAGGWARRIPVAVVIDASGQLCERSAEGLRPLSDGAVDEPTLGVVAKEDAPSSCQRFWSSSDGGPATVFLDSQGNLFSASAGRLQLLALNVVLCAPIPSGMLVVLKDRIQRYDASLRLEEQRELENGPWTPLVLGYDGRSGRDLGTLVLNSTWDVCSVLFRGQLTQLPSVDPATVVGAYARGGLPGAVLYREGDTHVELRGPANNSVTLNMGEHPLVSIATHPAQPYLAALNTEGALIVRHLSSGAKLLHVRPEDE